MSDIVERLNRFAEELGPAAIWYAAGIESLAEAASTIATLREEVERLTQELSVTKMQFEVTSDYLNEKVEHLVEATSRAQTAEAELTALRQRVVEVVGPFARTVPYGIAADDEEVTLPIKARHFRAARALHDELTQETK